MIMKILGLGLLLFLDSLLWAADKIPDKLLQDYYRTRMLNAEMSIQYKPLIDRMNQQANSVRQLEQQLKSHCKSNELVMNSDGSIGCKPQGTAN